MSKTIISALDGVAAAGGVTQSSKTVAAAISGLEGLVVSDGAAAVTNALKPSGDITVATASAVTAGITAALGEDGDITVATASAVTAGITAALGEDGDITEAIAAAIPEAAKQANSTATDVAGVVADLNALLAKLIAAGLMKGE